MEHEVKALRLKKQLVRWLIEDKSKDKEFSYRFTGQDSKLILRGFMHLVHAIRGDSTEPTFICDLLVIAFTATKLRDSVSLFSMYHFSQAKLQQLKFSASHYFSALVLFGSSISPCQWSIGKLVPVHSQWMFERYGTGLGINTMQGREAKHVQITSYAKHRVFKMRWFQVFRHDYIRKLWLPLQQPSLITYHETQESLFPLRVENHSLICHCGFGKREQKKNSFITVINNEWNNKVCFQWQDYNKNVFIKRIVWICLQGVTWYWQSLCLCCSTH